MSFTLNWDIFKDETVTMLGGTGKSIIKTDRKTYEVNMRPVNTDM